MLVKFNVITECLSESGVFLSLLLQVVRLYDQSTKLQFNGMWPSMLMFIKLYVLQDMLYNNNICYYACLLCVSVTEAANGQQTGDRTLSSAEYITLCTKRMC